MKTKVLVVLAGALSLLGCGSSPLAGKKGALEFDYQTQVVQLVREPVGPLAVGARVQLGVSSASEETVRRIAKIELVDQGVAEVINGVPNGPPKCSVRSGRDCSVWRVDAFIEVGGASAGTTELRVLDADGDVLDAVNVVVEAVNELRLQFDGQAVDGRLALNTRTAEKALSVAAFGHSGKELIAPMGWRYQTSDAATVSLKPMQFALLQFEIGSVFGSSANNVVYSNTAMMTAPQEGSANVSVSLGTVTATIPVVVTEL